MRVGIVALLQESNTFAAEATTLVDFERDTLAVGNEVQAAFSVANHEVAGFFDACAANKMEPVGLLAARATPGGVITAEAFDHLWELMLKQVELAGHLDGLLVAPHGATVAENHPDADGWWLSRLRVHVGRGTPIIGTLDPHANLSQAMVDATDALVAYRTNPHVDQRERGLEVGNLLARTLRGEIRPTQAAAMPPMAINIERQCTAESPCREFTEQCDAVRRQPGVLSVSSLFGFPCADVPEMGAAVLCVTDGDMPAAEQHADQLAREWWQRREQFVGEFIDIETALDRVVRCDDRVCLLDMGDNIGGGSPGDGTWLAEAIIRKRLGPAFVCLKHAPAVAAAQTAGVGAALPLKIGGGTDAGPNIAVECRVVCLHDGLFEEPQPRHGGWTRFEMGPTAVVETADGLTIQLTSRRVPPWSLQQLTCCGLDPRAFRLLVAKGVNAPLAAYGEVCPHVIRVNTPGITCADMRRLSYRHRRHPMFPFEVEARYEQ